MRGYSLLLILLFVQVLCLAQTVITPFPENLNHSIADRFVVWEDATSTFEVSDILRSKEGLNKIELTNEIENFNFTSSTYWINICLDNSEIPITSHLLLECARPITNEVFLYEYVNNDIINERRTGDAIPFLTKNYYSNKSILQIDLLPNAKKNFWLKIKSDGELISFPFILWEKKEYELKDKKTQFYNGYYYGVFLFVIIIYFFFYLNLKDKSFIFYSFYVFFSASLQFSLDGYTHQFLLRSGGFLTQHIVVFVAGLTVVFLLKYAQTYLKLKKRHAGINRVYNYGIGTLIFIIVLSLFPRFAYELSYPLINGFSLISIVLVLVTVYILGKKNFVIDKFFTIGAIVLVCGATLFILGNFSIIKAPWLTINALKLGTLIQILFLSLSMTNKYRELQEEKELAQLTVLNQLEEQNHLVESINEKLELQVKERTIDLEKEKEKLAQRNIDVMSSIRYTERIQRAVFPSVVKFKSLLKDSFIFFKPRDIVSGDFYWIESISTASGDELVVYATADCTGHGVPGAFLSIVGHNLLQLSRSQQDVNTPGEALDFLNEGIHRTFNSQFGDENIQDGMDIALCAIDKKNMKLFFSGAKNPIYIVRDRELKTYKGDRRAIGSYSKASEDKFTTHTIDLQKGDTIYSFSDGFPDQFGGEQIERGGKKFSYKKFRKLLVNVSLLPIEKQEQKLTKEFIDWMGPLEQLDDVLIIGVKI